VEQALPHERPAEEVAAGLGTDLYAGLASSEARSRLEQYGANELDRESPEPAWRRLLGQFKDALVLLLVAAAVNLRPDLFRAVVAEVPFVDVINTMLDESLPLTVGEFLEWGNPKLRDDYETMRRYSPYDNLRRTAYPAMYLRTSLNDSQVPYWEAAKYAARLRTLKTDDRPVLLSINMDAGHGGASGRYDALRERADVLAFMLWQWGLD